MAWQMWGDEATGGSRWYNPDTGESTQVDPTGSLLGMTPDQSLQRWGAKNVKGWGTAEQFAPDGSRIGTYAGQGTPFYLTQKEADQAGVPLTFPEVMKKTGPDFGGLAFMAAMGLPFAAGLGLGPFSGLGGAEAAAASAGGGGMDWSQLLGGDYGSSIAEMAANAAGSGAGYDPALFQGLAEGVSPGMTDWAQYFGTGGLNTTSIPGTLDFLSNVPAGSVMAGSGGAAGGGTSLIDRLRSLLNPSGGSGSGSNNDLLSMLGRAAPGLLGAFAASQQGDATADLANRFLEFGAPSRARYEGSFQPSFSMLNEPGYKDALDSTSQGILAKLSATGGNPFGNPGGLIEANKQINAGLALPALQNYRNQNAATGGYGAFNTAAPGAMAAGAQSGGDVWNALGSAAQSAFNPPKSLADQLKEIAGYGGLKGLLA